jgi:hypothetical protein
MNLPPRLWRGLQVMKMYMNLTVGEAGNIHWKLSEGAALAPGALMATLELDDPNCVTMAEVCVPDCPSPLWMLSWCVAVERIDLASRYRHHPGHCG